MHSRSGSSPDGLRCTDRDGCRGDRNLVPVVGRSDRQDGDGPTADPDSREGTRIEAEAEVPGFGYGGTPVVESEAAGGLTTTATATATATETSADTSSATETPTATETSTATPTATDALSEQDPDRSPANGQR
jgi:hypothetical protein